MEMIQKAQNLANLTFPVIEKSCNKLLIGKTFWKNVALPSILYGSSIIHLTNSELEKLQRVENGVYRKILGAGKSTPRAVLRGDVGASAMKTRIVDAKLSYMNSIYKGDKEILKIILDDMKEKESKWWKHTASYMEENSMSIREIKRLKKEDIKKKTRERDTAIWSEEVRSKESLHLYKEWKKEIKEEIIFGNTYASVVLFRAWSNTLALN